MQIPESNTGTKTSHPEQLNNVGLVQAGTLSTSQFIKFLPYESSPGKLEVLLFCSRNVKKQLSKVLN